ncbi:DUF3561 family protein, partial [Escherichia coli]|uniref:DUF3561 family protein n=1 Tax=Escherichia coli TaxID=562 RepID=UPI001FCF1DAF
GCNPTSSKFIHTWLRFGEIMRGSLSTWPFFLALMPVAVVVGIALHSLMDGKLRYSIVFTLVTVGIMFGALFMWLLG